MADANPWDVFLENENLQAHIVAGQLIGRVDNKNVILGHVNIGQLILTEDGIAVRDAMSATKRRGRKAPEAADLTLDVTDDVTAVEQLS